MSIRINALTSRRRRVGPGSRARTDAHLGSGAPAVAGRLPRLLLAAVLLAGLIAAFSLALRAAPPAAALDDACSNADLRTGFSAKLPDCRAYERVSPPGSRPYLSTSNPPSVARTQASISGDRIAWYTFYPSPDAPGQGFHYLSTRESSGWSTESAIPPQSQSSSTLVACAPSIFFSPDLSRGVLSLGFDAGDDGTTCGNAEPPLVLGAPEDTRNLYLRDSDSGSFQAVRVTAEGTPPGATALGDPPGNAEFQAASSDFSRVVFGDTAQLTDDAPNGLGLYLWNEDEGVVRLVSVLPDGTPVSGTLANAARHTGSGAVGIGPGFLFLGPAPFTGAVSSDGSRVFFQANGSLYMRDNADRPSSPIEAGTCTDPAAACTVQVDRSQGAGPGGGGTFAWASADGSLAYFTAPASVGLTADTVPGSGNNLYRYEAETGQLENLTAADDAGVLSMAGLSADGAYAYFVAEGSLASGAVAGQPNLYVARGGTTTFIATLSASDSYSWNLEYLRSRVSPNGQFFAFNSVESLTGYDNVDPDTGQPTTQIYLFEAATGELSCASCDPTGAPPSGSTGFANALQMTGTPAASHLQRNLADSGRLFFDSRNALVPRASNGKMNVYEFEPAGVGSCEHPDGCTRLISSGTSAHGSFFYDASASGDDVFFLTSQDLLGDGRERLPTLYDARVGGGFEQPDSAEPCSGDACKDDPAGPPADDDPGSAGTFPGNPGHAVSSRCRRFERKAERAAKRSRRLKGRARRANTKARSRHLRARARKQQARSKRGERRARHCRGGSR